MKISITITADVEPARVPTRTDPDEEALPRFVRWLVSRRTEGPLVKIKLAEKYEFTIFPEPAGKQLPILDLVSRTEEEEDELEAREASV